MRMIPQDIEQVNRKKNYKRTKLYKLLDKFTSSGYECVKIEDYPHKTAYSFACALRSSAKRFNFNSIVVSVRKRNVYLINTATVSRLNVDND